MPESEFQALVQQVLWAAFALALLFGAVAQRTQFCTMGALADVVNMGDWSRLRMWLLATGSAAAAFNAMVALGWLDAADSIYAGPRLTWLSHLVGGGLFGFGMVLASGCASKTLVRIGGGSLKALVVFVVLAVAAYATLRGLTGVLRVATVDAVATDLGRGQDLPTLLAAAGLGERRRVALALALLVAVVVPALVLARPDGRRAEVWIGGLGIGLAVAAMWWVSGRLGHVAEHPQTLEDVFVATASRRMEAMSFVAPFAYTVEWLVLYGDRTRVLNVGVVAVFGVVAGSAAMALATRSFRWEGFRGVEDTANHLVGAVLMGVGGVTALGCTIGQGISGVSTLSLGSFLALTGIVAGGLAGLRWQTWRVERAA